MIKYKKGFKYQLAEDYQVETVLLGYNVTSRYIYLNEQGLLTIYSGYAWDGPSGPTIDTKNFMRGALVHDALYQLIREEKLPKQERMLADIILKTICKEDGMCSIRAFIVYQAVKRAAGFAAKPSAKKKIITAP